MGPPCPWEPRWSLAGLSKRSARATVVRLRQHVDGVPATGDVTGAPSGWRGGMSTPGDDVGKYSTIAVGADGEPRVAYFDLTHGALKFAVHSASGWTVRATPIDDQGDAGRFADMAVGPDGRAAISYNALEERTDLAGAYVSKLKVAWAADAAASSWTIAEVESMDIPCWAALCGEDLVCVASSRTCETPADEADCGAGGCATGQACIAAVCEDLFESPIDFPEGVGPSIDIDAAGQRHVAFVDGIAEDLIYLNPDAGVREVVDGRSLAGRERAIVGDDSTIRVTASGEIWISYQEASSQSLLLAHRTAPGAWDVRMVDGEDSSGFFANMTLGTDGETPVLSTYWHRTATSGTTTTRYSYTAGARVFEVAP